MKNVTTPKIPEHWRDKWSVLASYDQWHDVSKLQQTHNITYYCQEPLKLFLNLFGLSAQNGKSSRRQSHYFLSKLGR